MRKKRLPRTRLGTFLAVGALAFIMAGVVSAASVAPIHITGANNDGKDCSDVLPGTTELRVSGPLVGGVKTDGTLTVTITQPSTVNPAISASFDFTANGPVLGVVVKDGEDGAYFYNYSPAGTEGDTFLTTPGPPTPDATFKNISHINFCYNPDDFEVAADLTASKTADASFTRTHDWDIDKEADQTTVYTEGGNESDAVNYDVTVTNTGHTDSGWTVSGQIDVTNPNENDDVTGVDVTDAIGAVDCDVTDGEDITVPADGSTSVDYECTLDSATDGTNTATVCWPDQELPEDGDLEAECVNPEASFTFGEEPATEQDACVTVNDTNPNGPQGVEVCLADSPKLFEYSETFTDPAGTCTEHENTASFVTADTAATGQAKTTVEDCQGADLIVTKNASWVFARIFAWTLDKSVDKTSVENNSGSATFNYTVEVSHDGGTDSGWQVTGTITIENPNDWQDVTLDSLTDTIDNGGTCTLDDPAPYDVPKASGDPLVNGELEVDYTCTYAAAPSPAAFTNTATAEWDKDVYHTPNGSDSGTADGAFGDPTTVTDECISVSDPADSNLPHLFCVGDTGDPDFSFTYSKTLTAGPGECSEYTNTATSTTNDTETEDTDSETVEYCNFNARRTPGYWKNHLAPTGSAGCGNLPNGTSCGGNPTALPYLQITLGTSYTVTTIGQAAAVFVKMNCSNSGNNAAQNNNSIGCLAGHLLAAKLNVANGANPCIAATITAAEALLTGIPYMGPAGNYSGISLATRNAAIALKNTLDTYNNGGGCS